MEVNNKIVKIKLKEALDKNGISISELSRKTKIERKSIYNILNQESVPNICTLVKLAKALSVKVEELLEY